jgi:hypothetical protein
LRFATAEIHKVERSGPDGGGGGGRRPAPAQTPAAGGGTGGNNYDEYGEEPF